MTRAASLGDSLRLDGASGGGAEPSRGGGFIHEIKIGAQVHDVPYMWSGFHVRSPTPSTSTWK